MEFSQDELTAGALNYSKKYLSQENLGRDEKLQMLSCAYAFLYLKAASQSSMKELAEAHELIANCFEKLGDINWASRHKETAKGYIQLKS